MSAADFLKDSLFAANSVAMSGLRSGLEIGRRESAARIAALETTMNSVADDMEKWHGDGTRPDEWKLREWIDALRKAKQQTPAAELAA